MYAQFSDSPQRIIFNPDGNDSGNACIANISPRERKKRQQFGTMQIIFGIIVLVAMLLLGADKAWRLLVFMPFAAGASSIFQALDKTWVIEAARGTRLMNGKSEKIEDLKEVWKIRWQALRVIIKGTLAGAALTAIAMLIP